jgi:hypothetical protein
MATDDALPTSPSPEHSLTVSLTIPLIAALTSALAVRQTSDADPPCRPTRANLPTQDATTLVQGTALTRPSNGAGYSRSRANVGRAGQFTALALARGWASGRAELTVSPGHLIQ